MYAIQAFDSIDLEACMRNHGIIGRAFRDDSSSSSGLSDFDEAYYTNRLPTPDIDYSRTVIIRAEEPKDGALVEDKTDSSASSALKNDSSVTTNKADIGSLLQQPNTSMEDRNPRIREEEKARTNGIYNSNADNAEICVNASFHDQEMPKQNMMTTHNVGDPERNLTATVKSDVINDEVPDNETEPFVKDSKELWFLQDPPKSYMPQMDDSNYDDNIDDIQGDEIDTIVVNMENNGQTYVTSHWSALMKRENISDLNQRPSVKNRNHSHSPPDIKINIYPRAQTDQVNRGAVPKSQRRRFQKRNASRTRPGGAPSEPCRVSDSDDLLKSDQNNSYFDGYDKENERLNSDKDFRYLHPSQSLPVVADSHDFIEDINSMQRSFSNHTVNFDQGSETHFCHKVVDCFCWPLRTLSFLLCYCISALLG